jgi:hypothetical protein
VDGDLTAGVDACREGYTFARFGLAACDIDTAAPGSFALRFWVVDSASGQEVAAVRTMHVLALCVPDEVRCSDHSCGTGGTCLASQGGAQDAAGSEGPTVSLRSVNGRSSSEPVPIPVGWQYTACAAGAISMTQTPCEPGQLALES